MTESAEELSFGMDAKTKFQLQPSSFMEAIEMLIGTGLDRVHTTNLLSGTEPVGRRPTVKNAAWIRDPPHDWWRTKAPTCQHKVVANLCARCWKLWPSLENNWTPSQQESRVVTLPV